MEKIYFLNLDIATKIAGVESSALVRSKLFSEYLGVEPIFVSNSYNWNLHKNKRNIIDNNRSSKNLSVINLYDFFQDAENLEYGIEKLFIEDFAHFRAVDVPGTSDARLYDEKGKFIAYCKRHEDDKSVNFINYIDDGKVWRRETYDSRGFLSKVDILEKREDFENCYETFHRPDGSVAISKKTIIKSGFSSPVSINLIDKRGTLLKSFNSDSEILDYWIDLLVAESGEKIFVVDRCSEFYGAIKNSIFRKGSKDKVIPVIHSVHTAGDVYTGEINKFYKNVLEDISKPDAIVVFTQKQKDDIVNRFGEANIEVIPHSHEPVNTVNGISKRIRKRIVYLARFAPEKNHEMALQIFKKVLEVVSDAELHLYGFGSEKNLIESKIKELSLENNVVINDYVDNVSNIYQDAGLSILTSGIEGFCLGVMESLANGCPVISFDINYGPSSMIKNGINGFLVPFKNIDFFAKQVINVIENEKVHSKLIDEAKKSVDSLSHKEVSNKWRNLLDSMKV